MSCSPNSSDKVPLPGFTSCVTPVLFYRSNAWAQLNLSGFSYALYEPNIAIQFKITGRTRHETEPVICSWSSSVTQVMQGCSTCGDSCGVLRSLKVNPLRGVMLPPSAYFTNFPPVILSFSSQKCW